MTEYTDDNLFYGTVACYFKATTGSTHRFVSENFTETSEQKFIDAARLREEPVAHLGADYTHLVYIK